MGIRQLGFVGNFFEPNLRGPSAFSEPETRAVRDFCIAHGVRTANNSIPTSRPLSIRGRTTAHSILRRLLHPEADDMMRDANYSYGFTLQSSTR